MATIRAVYRRAVDYLRNREWIGTVAIVTAAAVAAVEYVDQLSTLAQGLTGDETPAELLVIAVGLWRARAGVSSNDTVAAEIEWARAAERDKRIDPV